MIGRSTVPEKEVYRVLSSTRRRKALVHLWRQREVVTLRELSEAIATAETGQEPAPRDVRESVYNSLHQTHLPKLDNLDLVRYDADRKEIEVLPKAHALGPHMDVVITYGVTWDEFYRTVGICSLFIVIASLIELPLFSVLEPLAWSTIFLAAFALSTAYQLWKHRWGIVRLFRPR